MEYLAAGARTVDEPYNSGEMSGLREEDNSECEPQVGPELVAAVPLQADHLLEGNTININNVTGNINKLYNIAL